jgi:hypothetical protein
MHFRIFPLEARQCTGTGTLGQGDWPKYCDLENFKAVPQVFTGMELSPLPLDYYQYHYNINYYIPACGGALRRQLKRLWALQGTFLNF